MAKSPPGPICVAHGFAVRVSVDHGRLVVRDGIGRAPRTRTYGRATHGLKRLVLIGHSGFVTLEAIRWLADVGVGFVQVDTDGRILSASTGLGLDDPRLRRAQAVAWATPTGVGCARTLLRAKIEGQVRVARKLDAPAEVLEQMERCYEALGDVVARPDELMVPEAAAAVAYWDAWRDVPVRFAAVDRDRVPDHWHTFGQRRSPVTRTSRLAANPANAILNYLYAILEGEARLACLAMGLDPGLGVLHADLKARDSLALDVMEAVRPDVDEFVLDLLGRRVFRAGDFFETRQGVCRVMPPLAHELASTGPDWAHRLGPVVERLARELIEHPESRVRTLPSPLTQANRSAGRASKRKRGAPRSGGSSARPICVMCGEATPGRDRAYCDRCLPERIAAQSTAFARAGRERLAELREKGIQPNRSGAGAARQARRMAEHRRELAAWEAPAEGFPDARHFLMVILPRLSGLSPQTLARATGLSRGYCGRIQRGEYVPHPRHWKAFMLVAGKLSKQEEALGA